MNEQEYANATQSERDSYDEMCAAEAQSEMMAERYNEYCLEGIDLGPSPDDEYERWLESMEERP